MYSFEEKKHALDVLQSLNGSTRAAVRVLGYPSRTALINWQREFRETGNIRSKSKHKPRYSEDEINFAVEYYMNHGKNITHTVKVLGYPSRSTLSCWIEDKYPEQESSVLKGTTLLKYSYDEKIKTVIDFCCREGSAEKIVEETGISRTSLYNWKKQLLPQKVTKSMLKESKNKTEKLHLQISELQEEVKELQSQIYRLQMEKDALEVASKLLKKHMGINLRTLSNPEKAMIIDALREKYCLSNLLKMFNFSKSSYFYQHNALKRCDKYLKIRAEITAIFNDSGKTYGYRRIHAMLKRQSVIISEKVIRRLMKEEQLSIKRVRIRKYNSYKGEISPAVPNLIKRNFHVEEPNQKWLTDITEFHIPAGRIYLSPIIDCFDGMPVSWTIGTSPNAQLVNTMLDLAIDQLPKGSHPIIHSDRGAHYRWPGWIKRVEMARLTRSMSKKGYTPDNAACEAFWGRLKNEMFYCRSWNNVSIQEFAEILDSYMKWYSTTRIKISLGAMSPIEYRRSLGLVA